MPPTDCGDIVEYVREGEELSILDRSLVWSPKEYKHYASSHWLRDGKRYSCPILSYPYCMPREKLAR